MIKWLFNVLAAVTDTSILRLKDLIGWETIREAGW